MHLAVFDAINAIDRRFQSYGQLVRYLIGFNASGYFINPDLLALAQGAA